MPGFRVAGVVRSGGEALRFLRHTPVDLILLDLYLPEAGQIVAQGDVDRMLATLRGSSELPKGMTQDTLDTVAAHLREHPDGLSAQAVADATGVSRVTARRYLEHLVDTGAAVRLPRYGGVGRPELLYRMPTRS